MHTRGNDTPEAPLDVDIEESAEAVETPEDVERGQGLERLERVERRTGAADRRGQRDRRVKPVGNGVGGRPGAVGSEPVEPEIELPWPAPTQPPDPGARAAGARTDRRTGAERRRSGDRRQAEVRRPPRSQFVRRERERERERERDRAQERDRHGEPPLREQASVTSAPRRRRAGPEATDPAVANRTETIDQRVPGRRVIKARVGEMPPRVDRAVYRQPSARRASAGRALAVGLLCFAIWTLFDANQLYHNASTSPFGTRRSVAMSILRPIAAVANALRLSGPVNAANSALGRNQAATSAKLPQLPPAPPSGTRPPNNVSTSGVAPRPHTHVGQAAGSETGVQHYSWPPPVLQPTPAHPLVMLSIGDSVGDDLGLGLLDQYAQDPYVRVIPKGKIDTGLARPDVWNWPVVLENDLRQYHPAVVVVMMGANDDQPLLLPNGTGVPTGTQQWDRLYRERVALLMAEATDAGAHMMWVGLPPMAGASVSSTFAQHVNAIAEQEATAYHGVTYVSSWQTLGGTHGNFVIYKRIGGNVLQLRYSDGVHLAPSGYDLLASALVDPMQRVWHVNLHTRPLIRT